MMCPGHATTWRPAAPLTSRRIDAVSSEAHRGSRVSQRCPERPRSPFPSTVSQSVTPLARHRDGYLFYVGRGGLPGRTIVARLAPAQLVRHGIGTPSARHWDASRRRLLACI